jgi:hypothetical protein
MKNLYKEQGNPIRFLLGRGLVPPVYQNGSTIDQKAKAFCNEKDMQTWSLSLNFEDLVQLIKKDK